MGSGPTPSLGENAVTGEQGNVGAGGRGLYGEEQSGLAQSSVASHSTSFLHCAERSFQKARPIRSTSTTNPIC